MPPTFDCGVISSSTRPHPDNFISPNAICTDTNSVASSVCPGVSNMIKYFRITSGQCYTMGFRIATHPNPANKVLTVKYKMEESNDVDILLFDSIGNLVKSIKQKKSLVWDNENSVNTGDLREGMYVLVLKSSEKIEKKTIYINH